MFPVCKCWIFIMKWFEGKWHSDCSWDKIVLISLVTVDTSDNNNKQDQGSNLRIDLWIDKVELEWNMEMFYWYQLCVAQAPECSAHPSLWTRLGNVGRLTRLTRSRLILISKSFSVMNLDLSLWSLLTNKLCHNVLNSIFCKKNLRWERRM